MDPGNPVLGVVIDDRAAQIRAVLVLRDAEAFRKISFYQVAGHGADRAAREAAANRKNYPIWPRVSPILDGIRAVLNVFYKCFCRRNLERVYAVRIAEAR